MGTLLHIALDYKLRFTVTSLCTSKVRSLTHQYWPCKEEMLDIGLMAQVGSAGYRPTLETVETQVGTLLHIALENKLSFTVTSLYTYKVRSLTHQYWPCKEEMLDIGVMAQCRSAG